MLHDKSRIVNDNRRMFAVDQCFLAFSTGTKFVHGQRYLADCML